LKPVVLVGAEAEENLSIRYLASSIEGEGFRAELQAWSDPPDPRLLAEAIRDRDPLVVGLSLPFQTRAPAILGLGRALRSVGCEAHLCVGGHFATFEHRNLLRDFPEIDSAVRHEGEIPFLTLCKRLRDGEAARGIPGVTVREDGQVFEGGRTPLPPLDTLPFPDRRGPPHEILGVRTSPIVGSRGCYADCSFCCIHAYAESADGPRYRRRSPESIAEEMSREYVHRGVRLFVFHDDNFLVPSRRKNLERYGRLNQLLQDRGLQDIGLVIKCRPNDVDAELFELLKSMGTIRAYVGIETNSPEGIVSLNRRVSPEDNEGALRILNELDIYHSFNVLLFDPETTLEGVQENLDFMERHARTPFNFCRAEVYAGTPLKRALEAQGRLEGDYFAWNYRMRDPRVEVLFRMATTAFHTRNFRTDGLANLNMGLRFDAEVAQYFYPSAWDSQWQEELLELSQAIGKSSVALMREALAFVREEDLEDHEAVKEKTVDLARRVAGENLGLLRRCKDLRGKLERRLSTRYPDRCPEATLSLGNS
jgi:anaerobic magnesium-protoporphyrin IX monomethyl ester cyclase